MKDRGVANRTQLHEYLRRSSMCFAHMAAGMLALRHVPVCFGVR